MIVVHDLGNFPSRQVLWLLEEMGLPYETRRCRASDALLHAQHPWGRSPVLRDGEQQVAEVGTIFEYLLECYPVHGLVPVAGSEAWLDYSYWRHYAEGSLMRLLLVEDVADAFLRWQSAPFFLRTTLRTAAGRMKSAFFASETGLHLDYLEATTGESQLVRRFRFLRRRYPDEFSHRFHRGS